MFAFFFTKVFSIKRITFDIIPLSNSWCVRMFDVSINTILSTTKIIWFIWSCSPICEGDFYKGILFSKQWFYLINFFCWKYGGNLFWFFLTLVPDYSINMLHNLYSKVLPFAKKESLRNWRGESKMWSKSKRTERKKNKIVIYIGEHSYVLD